jgi:DNA-directed RNA polymerase specialized sigma24 family protein
MRVVDKAVLGLPVKHRMAVILHYVQLRTPPYICRKVVIPHVKFGEWMFDCRAMVLNLLRRADAA